MMEKSTSVSSKAKSSEGSNASSPLVELQETLSSIFQKRTRALRKKVRNVEEIERKVQDGKEINDQQEEAIRSKGTTLSLLEEVERLRKAIEEEVQKTIATEEAEAKKMKRKKKREEVKKKKEKKKKRILSRYLRSLNTHARKKKKGFCLCLSLLLLLLLLLLPSHPFIYSSDMDLMNVFVFLSMAFASPQRNQTEVGCCQGGGREGKRLVGVGEEEEEEAKGERGER